MLPVSSQPVEAFDVLRFAQALLSAKSLESLGRVFASGFDQRFDIPMYGFNVCEPETMRLVHNVATVSDVFVARYARELWDSDPMRSAANEMKQPVSNLELMSMEEWEESLAYRRVFSIHRMRYLIEAPIIADGRILGNLHLAASDRELGPSELKLASGLGEVMAAAIQGIWATDGLTRERDQLLHAFDLIETAVVISDPLALGLRYNAAARTMLAAVVDAETQLHRLLVPPSTDAVASFSRRLDIELVAGGRGILHAHSSAVGPRERTLTTVLELHRETPATSFTLLAALTPREAEVARLVADGLTDREIADRLHLSHHTVSQYVKRIYRKLDVESRVGLTRLLLGQPLSVRRN